MKWFLKPFQRAATRKQPSARIEFEAVEPRVLFSATVAETVEETNEAHHTPPVIQEEAPLVAEPSVAAVESDPVPVVAHAILSELNFYAADLETSERREIVFVSTGVEGYEYLVSNLDPAYEVHLIDGESDGVRQIAEALKGKTGVDAIHLIGHGEEGRLFLGETSLDADSMEGSHREWLESIAASLGSDADLLIYGCDFTSGELGIEAATLLGQLTGADVAASSDLTGYEDLGGDWVLETEIGSVEANGLSLTSWRGLLAGVPPILDLNTTDSVTVASDDFSSNTANGGTGWAGDWTKAVDPDGDDIQWTGGTMIIREFDKLPSVTRAVNLSGYLNPSLTLTYATSGNLEATDTFVFEFSTNGGSSWTTLESFADDSSATRTYSLGSIGAANTVFRLRLTGFNNAGDGNNETVTIDNVSVTGQLTSHSATYLTNATPVAIASTNVGITDVDDPNMQLATITLTNRQAGDVLSVSGSLPAGISASSYNPTTGVLTLSGNATRAQYETALEQIRFASTSSVAGSRLINVTVFDGTGTSNTAVSTIAVSLDSDADGVANDNDLDDDGDGILDQNEMNLVTSSSTTSISCTTRPSRPRPPW